MKGRRATRAGTPQSAGLSAREDHRRAKDSHCSSRGQAVRRGPGLNSTPEEAETPLSTPQAGSGPSSVPPTPPGALQSHFVSPQSTGLAWGSGDESLVSASPAGQCLARAGLVSPGDSFCLGLLGPGREPPFASGGSAVGRRGSRSGTLTWGDTSVAPRSLWDLKQVTQLFESLFFTLKWGKEHQL